MLRKLIVATIVGNFVFMLLSVLGPMVTDFRDTAVAANTTVTYTADANVPSILELNAQLHPMVYDSQIGKWVPNWSVNATSGLAFGTLAADSYGNLWGNTSYAAIFIPATSGRQYWITWSGQGLSGPGGTIGTGGDNVNGSTQDAYLVIPDYQWWDLWDPNDPNSKQQGPPPGAKVESIGKVASTGNRVYTSDTAGLSRIIRAYIGITGVPGPPDNPDFKWKNYDKGYDGTTPQGIKQEYQEGTKWDVVTTNQLTGGYSGSITFTLNI